MPTELSFVNLEDALIIRTARKPSLIGVMLSVAGTGGFVLIVAFHFVNKLELSGLTLLAAILAFLFARRKRNVELRITRLEFASQGRVGDNFGSNRRVPTADIQWLEYQDDTIGPATSHHPGGIYAVLARRSICLLPDVDKQQTALILQRINDRFPEFKREWAKKSVFGQHFYFSWP